VHFVKVFFESNEYEFSLGNRKLRHLLFVEINRLKQNYPAQH